MQHQVQVGGTKDVLVDFLENVLEIEDAKSIEFQQVHRLGKPNSDNASGGRTIIARFLRYSGPVQTSCFCRAELNSEIKFDKSRAEARRLNQTFELSSAEQLSSTSSVVLHDSGTTVIQTSCFCRVELNS